MRLKKQKINNKELKYQQNTWNLSNKIRSTNTFNKIKSTDIRLPMRNEVNNWQ